MNILVIGGGIAACQVIHSLLNYTDSITFISDYPSKPNSSSMAGASIVPYNFNKKTTTIYSKEIFQKIIKKYQQLESRLQQYFLFPLPLNIYEEDKNNGFSSEKFTTYTETYFLHIRLFLQESFAFFRKKIKVIEDRFMHDEVQMEETFVLYKNRKYDKVIFCEGIHVHSNPFFQPLKMNENWGQVLILEIENLERNRMHHFHHRLIPIEENQWWYGASHHWNYPSEELQNNWSQEQIEMLQKALKKKVTLINTFIHPRPTSPGQFPYIGQHPNKKMLYIMNGLGSRGMMHAARYADDFAEMILTDRQDLKEYDSERFHSFF